MLRLLLGPFIFANEKSSAGFLLQSLGVGIQLWELKRGNARKHSPLTYSLFKHLLVSSILVFAVVTQKIPVGM
jgi:hypothetical protein